MKAFQKTLLVLTAIGATAQVFGATYYVATNGSDANLGTDVAKPWKTVKKGLTSLKAGDVLLIRGGTYVESLSSVSIKQGTSTARITVQAYPGEKPVLQGLLWLSRPSYWTIDGLGITWQPGTSSRSHMVKITNGVGWILKNCDLWGARSYADLLVAGTLTSEPNNWLVTGNRLHDVYKSNDTNQDHAIYCNTGKDSGSGVIERNLIYNVANGNGVKVAGNDPGTGSRNVTVRYNTIYNCTQGILVGWETNNCMVYRNIVVKTASNYGCIRGFQLTGSNNVAYDNLGNLAKCLLLNYDAGTCVKDGGGNLFPIDPQFADLVSFKTLNPAAVAYGRWGTTAQP